MAEKLGSKEFKYRNAKAVLKEISTKVTGFPAKGVETRNPIERVIDGQFGTMTWRAQVPKKGEERPWVRLDFKQAVEVSRLRMSSNREYFFDTDYLEKKPYLPRYEFDLERRRGYYQEIHRLIYEDQPYTFLFNRGIRAAINKRIHGVTVSTSGGIFGFWPADRAWWVRPGEQKYATAWDVQ